MSIKEVLMSRDGMSEEEAEELIYDAMKALLEYINDGDLESAENVCEEFFGLEPDYITDLL